MHQTRADLRGEINTGGGFLDKIRFRSGFADYQHSEIEDTGEVGTTFYSKGIESRLELVQPKQDGWEGAIGAQMLMRDFRIVSEEKFLPKNETRPLSLFTLPSIALGQLRAAAGARIEHRSADAHADPPLANSAPSRHSAADRK